MLATFLQERDFPRRGRELAARGRETRDLLARDARAREMARRGREARDWLIHDERGRIVGLVVVSVAMSIVVSLLATAMVGAIGRRRASAAAAPPKPDLPEASEVPGVAAEAGVGVPVMEAVAPVHAAASGAVVADPAPVDSAVADVAEITAPSEG